MNLFLKKKIINPEELKKIINLSFVKILDCRWFLGTPDKGYSEYKKSHIPNAIFFDLDKISNKNIKLPHMLPEKYKFHSEISKLGISKKSKIIIYDQNGFFSSSRIWFTFHKFGFDKVQILNGGFNLWKRKKFKISKNRQFTKYTATKTKIAKNLIIKKNEIECFLKKKINKHIIVDARPSSRFDGKSPEPRTELKSGHIPGSINIPYDSIFNNNGKLLCLLDLKKKFNEKINFKMNRKIICTCGSGITACNIFFLLEIFGIKNKKLYDGSWAEWGRK